MNEEFTLRERKFAQTKQAILSVVLDKLKEKPLHSISVKEICSEANVSEATFFNYYPSKTDALVYFIQLWTIEMGWYARKALSEGGGLAAIEAIFEMTGKKCDESLVAMSEIIVYQAQMRELPKLSHVTLVERRMAFPDLDDVDDLPSGGITDLFPALLTQAIADRQLPKSLDMSTAISALLSFLFGIPLARKAGSTQSVAEGYAIQLQILWTGLRSHIQASL